MPVLLLLIPLLSAQFTVPKITKPEHPQADIQPLPETRRPDEATLKAEYAQSVADVEEILRMAREAKAMLDKSDPHTLPADALKNLSEIEKRAKAARKRLKR
jgi:Skp family chaperone for outer membrane proteins